MARNVGDSGQAAVFDAGQIKRLLKIAQTTNHPYRDQTVITLSYWLVLRRLPLRALRGIAEWLLRLFMISVHR